MHRLNRLAALTLCGSLGFANINPGVAYACGGTFCDSGPTAMPVDQTGENILFVLDGTHVEAHVQIQYQGEAERFAWIVPVQKVPEVTVGSQLLFDGLLSSTVPNVGYNQTFDSCDSAGGTGGSGFGNGGTGGSGGNGGTGGSSGGPSVLYTKTVGAFEVTALEGGTAQEVVDWLGTNGYQNIPAAANLLQDYVARGFVFVAIKLTAGAEVNEIHPLVFRYEGTEPCVPIKLTAVAATENMGVRTFFLGDDRVMPVNYKHIVPNPVRLDWLSFGSNYEQAITRSVDSPVSNGHGFVTEYAGPTAVVPAFNLFRSSWISGAYQGLRADEVIETLTSQGLISCYPGFCEAYHPMVMPILNANLPVPSGIDEGDFYSCVSCYVDPSDPNAWKPAAFAQDFQDRIVTPGKRAKDLLALYPFLTRLYTTLSPAEMTEDPIFAPAPGLPSVPALGLANLRTTCSGARGMTLPDDRQVSLKGGSWPLFDSQMPWAERIEQYNEKGELIVLVDNSEQIDQQLKSYNDANGWPPAGANGGNGAGANGGNGAGANGGNGAGANGGSGGTGVGASTGGASAGNLGALPDDQGSTSGCTCSIPGGNSASNDALLGGLGVALLGLGLRRRRNPGR